MTAKEIFDKYCDNATRYLNEPEALEAMKEYAREKCKVQRALCATLNEEEMSKIYNAPQPIFD